MWATSRMSSKSLGWSNHHHDRRRTRTFSRPCSVRSRLSSRRRIYQGTAGQWFTQPGNERCFWREPGREVTSQQVPLASVADIQIVEGPSMIKSENGLLRAYVQLNVRDRDIVGFVEEAQRRSLSKSCYRQVCIWSGADSLSIKSREANFVDSVSTRDRPNFLNSLYHLSRFRGHLVGYGTGRAGSYCWWRLVSVALWFQF